jgi:Icc protein
LTRLSPAVSIPAHRKGECPIVRLGHISDLHLADRARYPRNGLSARHCDRHSPKILKKILTALEEERIDHLVVTGDVTLSSESSEFARAQELLAPWIERRQLTIVPGNHDVWTYEAAATWRFLREMGPDGRGMKKVVAIYPIAVELSPEVTLVALDSARYGEDPTTTPGALGPEQLVAARELVRSATKAGRAVVLALHHHLVIPPERVPSDANLARMPLADADKVVRLLAELPIAAVLHGHRHATFRIDLPGAAGPTPVLCSGSASRVADEPARRPRALVYELDAGGLHGVASLVTAA